MSKSIYFGLIKSASATEISFLIFIVLAFTSALLLIDPFGDFPLNDDWSFARAVKTLITEGEFRPTDWTSMPLVTNVLWGALFCLPTGFSFDALRLSTIVSSLLGVIGTFLIMREIRLSRPIALITALTLAFNPIYFSLSNTFMTDVPFTTLGIITALFLARYLRTLSDIDLLCGAFIAAVAILSRQLAIAIPLAFAIALLLRPGLNLHTGIRAFIPIILPLGFLLGFQEWLANVDRTPVLYYQQTVKLFDVITHPAKLLAVLPRNSYVAFVYLGWFLSPILAIVGYNHFRNHKNIFVIIYLVVILFFIVGITAPSIYNGHLALMPLDGNIIDKSGIGPVTLHDSYILGLNHMPEWPAWFWAAVTLLGVIGGALLTCVIVIDAIALASKVLLKKTGYNETLAIFFFMAGAIYLAPLLIAGFFDRYLIPAIPLIAAGILARYAKRQDSMSATPPMILSISVLMLLVMVPLAIGGTHDYLAWNRARWQALNELTENQGVKPEEIDGGFEFNGFHLYNHSHPIKQGQSWWWVKDDTYQIGSGNVSGYSIIKDYDYDRWIPPGKGKIVILKIKP